jgi:hypothetical protein
MGLGMQLPGCAEKKKNHALNPDNYHQVVRDSDAAGSIPVFGAC